MLIIEIGLMEISWLEALLNSITQFNLSSSSCDNASSNLVLKYYQRIDEALKVLRPLLDGILDSEIASDETLEKALEELDAAVNEGKDLIEGWHQMMSKVYFVFHIESIATKIQMFGLEICRIIDSLPQSLSNGPHTAPIQEMLCIKFSETSDTIEDAMRDLQEESTPSPEALANITNALNLRSNLELLLEIVALEKVKADQNRNPDEVERIENMIALVTHMHDSLMKMKQSQTVNGLSIPPDFCCPLSLELMADPVIVASGQTYERAFIRNWLDQGLTVCPKTLQNLSHTTLIPNYTVKALIENWCEINNIKLPDPVKSVTLNLSTLTMHPERNGGDSHHGYLPSWSNHSRSPDLTRSESPHRNHTMSNGAPSNDRPVSPPLSNANTEIMLVNGSGSSAVAGNGFDADITQVSQIVSRDGELFPEVQNVGISGENGVIEEQSEVHNQTAAVSIPVPSIEHHHGEGDANNGPSVSDDLTQYSCDTSGELKSAGPAPSAPSREPEFPLRLAGIQSARSQSIWSRSLERRVPRIVSTPSSDVRPDLSGVETRVRNLIEDLESSSSEVQRAAAHELRVLAKHSMENRILIANCGAINHLVRLLFSTDLKTQENAVTALLNLSINDNNKNVIADAGAIEPLIHVLKTGSMEAKENSAATLFSLSVSDVNKAKIGRAGAIEPLVELLGNGTPRGKKDAATALFNLSIFHENKPRIVEAGAVRYLVELMDPAAGMVDKAVAVLANLSTINEGRIAIGQADGITVLVEVVELGSARGKENAAAALLQLCTNIPRFSNMVLLEGAVPPLVALSQTGTPRAKEKYGAANIMTASSLRVIFLVCLTLVMVGCLEDEAC
ncbi:hypothetical protein ACLOJK_021404 [Asimina triloba]